MGVGAGPAGPVLAGPLFRRFNEIHYRYLRARRYRRRAIARAYYSRTTSKVLATPLILHPHCFHACPSVAH